MSNEIRGHRFDSVPISAYRWLVSYIFLLCYTVVIFYPAFDSVHFSHTGALLIAVFSALFAGVVWYTRKITVKRYLLLNDKELKQVEVKKEFAILWGDMSLVQINKNSQGEISTLSILTNAGKLWNLPHYSDMGKISEYVRNHARTGRIKGLVNSIRTRPAVSGIAINTLSIIILFGWRVFPNYVPVELVIVPIVIGFWLYPTKVTSYQSKRLLKHMLYGYGILAVFIILVLILLVIFAR